MAHIQVQRRSMRKEEWIELRYCRLKRSIYGDMTEISPIYVREAHQTDENSYEYYDEAPRQLKTGDVFYTPDGTAFLTFEAVIPESLRKSEVFLYIKTASEMIVKINGRYAGGVDPNRQRISLSGFDDNGVIKAEITGFNRSKPDDERNPETLAKRGCRQSFEGIYFTNVNIAAQALCYDCELLTDIIGSDVFSEDYREFVKSKLDTALDLVDYDSPVSADMLKAADYIKENIYADTTYRGSGRVALVGHSHLDIAYYWRAIHAVQKNMRTVLIQLRLMDKYPDYRYCHTQAYLYETLEKYYPEIFDELKQKISEGRFEVVGGMYVEPDCNIPCAESLIRQCLYGQSFFREKFGITVSSCWLPDVFGNSWILPQILKKSGMDYFVSNKMSTWNDTNRFPHNAFIWRGIDGSNIYACVPPTHFITWNTPSQICENRDAYQDKLTNTETLSMFGYGDGGSGGTEEMIELMQRESEMSAMPAMRHVSAGEYLKENFNSEKHFDIWDGELYLEMHRGTFTTKSELKKNNRMLEYKFRNAELLSLCRLSQGRKYPSQILRESYKKFLVNQFHDILPGSHIHPVYCDAMRDYGEINTALDGIIDENGEYFNTLNYNRNGTEFIEKTDGRFVRHGKNGVFRRVSFAPLSHGEILDESGGEWFCCNENELSTPFYEVRMKPDGSFISLYDKKLCREWVKGDFNKLRLFDDRPGDYDAWDILPDYEKKSVALETEAPLHIDVFDGECVQLSVTHKTSKSTWTQLIRFFRSSKLIEVENIVNWQEKHVLAKAYFNGNVLTREVVCDTSAGYIKRDATKNTSWQEARFECCNHKWFDMSETDGGISVINEGKYGVGITAGGISLSLLRATERPDPQSDLGEHDFCYAILLHEGDFIKAQTNITAFFYNSPLIKAQVQVPEILKEIDSELFLQSVKLSENGEFAVLRLSEQNGKRGKVNLGQKVFLLNMLEDIGGEVQSIDYAPFEIITLGIPLNNLV